MKMGHAKTAVIEEEKKMPSLLCLLLFELLWSEAAGVKIGFETQKTNQPRYP